MDKDLTLSSPKTDQNNTVDRSILLRELLAATARRNEQAFAQLYQHTSAKLFGVALRILKREDWAEEVLQESFINIWNSAASYSSSLSAPMTWMISIVRNRALDQLRRPKFEVSDEDNVLIDAALSENLGPLDQLTQHTETMALAKCLEKLDSKQRQTISLAFFHGLTHTELAKYMRQPLGTVKTWVRRGLEKLKNCLQA